MNAQQLVEVGDVELCVETFGDPDRPTLLLVSGAAASMDWWDTELCERLAGGGRYVVRYDHRDTGRSTTGTPGHPSYDGWQLGRDCAALIEALGRGPVHLVGISLGGGIGQLIALRHPELLASLTLVSTSATAGVDSRSLPGPTARASASFETPPPEPDWSDPESYADWVVAGSRAFTGTLPFDEPRVRAVATTVHARSSDPAAAGNHWLVVGADDDADDADEPLDVRRITTPTLVLHGSEDPLFPLPHGRALAAAIPAATLLVLDGVGHEVPPPSTWDLVVPALLRHTAGTLRDDETAAHHKP
ncbi:alpha/beta fold hydrolase [Nocardioides cynanchi]|uniref:alpha/beta fold hydrolase n=1 Tax=Nocardioides cynanchi TaxID=2558918 RepID=UPI001246591F|nr:alpha/beta hydrolase [Nocardioides cynanchi]